MTFPWAVTASVAAHRYLALNIVQRSSFMRHIFRHFAESESGAVTVDWVVLCAGIVALAVAIVTAMQSGALDLSDGVSTYLSGWF